MRSIRLLAVMLLALMLLAVACSNDSAAPSLPSDGAIITFAFDQLTDTMRVHVRHAATITEAERRLSTGMGARMPVGPIVRGAGVDARYPFHFLADSVRLADLAAEVCDGRPMRTASQVDDFFRLSTGSASATRAIWCPWGAYPIAVQRLP